jgi:hypothetical protein
LEVCRSKEVFIRLELSAQGLEEVKLLNELPDFDKKEGFGLVAKQATVFQGNGPISE